MIEDFEIFLKAKPETVIWRYMDLDKFEALLRNKALFFCRADRFADPFEGSIPKREADFRFESAKGNPIYNKEGFNEPLARSGIQGISDFHMKFKSIYTINCWHINNSENDSMWHLYLKSNGGIAIKTTVKRLIESFNNTAEKVLYSKVRYLDYEKDRWYHKNEYPHKQYNMLMPLIHKRKEFEQENELRVLHDINDHSNDYWGKQPIENGKNIDVDIDKLIEEVYCAPTSNGKQMEKVKKLSSNYNYIFETKKSILSSVPIY